MLMAYASAVVVAYISTILDLWSSDHRKTFEFLARCLPAHALAVVYGLAAIVLVFLFDLLIVPAVDDANDAASATQFLKLLEAEPLAKGIFVGAFTSSLVNLRLFSLPNGNAGQEPVPIGIRTLTQMFDIPLREEIRDRLYLERKRFCETHLATLQDKDIDVLRGKANAAIPGSYAADRKAIIRADFQDATDSVDLLRKFLERFGKRWLRDTFK